MKLKKESYRLLCTLEVLEQSFDARRQLLGKDRDVVRACVRRFPEEGLEMDFHSLRYAFITYMLEKRFASNHSIDSRAQKLKIAILKACSGEDCESESFCGISRS